MNIRIKLFATLKDRAGSSHVEINLPEDATVATLLDLLAIAQPKLAPSLPTSLVAVNQEFAFGSTPIRSGDEVALFPPVSGGSSAYPEIFRIADHQIDLNELVASVTLPSTGAVCTFTGTVRGQSSDHETSLLNYEAYTPMAEAKMKQVANEIRSRWLDVQGIAMVQRVGQLKVGEFTVMIAVSAGHRDQGIFEAARYGIDRLKEIVPVWKQEVGPQGERWVEGHYRPTEADANSK
ncbi:MAG TPA: molybdopterin converting factor subunit 1, partial [Anaerolineae bacterium]|nr:molybdopterin converting factor subunit 1 [Anaerolineae bacterium]